MGLIDRVLPHHRKQDDVALHGAPAPEDHPPYSSTRHRTGETGAALHDALPSQDGRTHRLQGMCPHCHKRQEVLASSTWVTTRCTYCSAEVTLHA